MLKLRLRSDDNTTIKLHVEPHTTPRQLLLLAAHQHAAPPQATALSLDKTTALAPQDAPLSHLGIASGDLLYLIAAPPATNAPTPDAAAVAPPPQPANAGLAELCGMGFGAAQAIAALERAGGSVARAVELLSAPPDAPAAPSKPALVPPSCSTASSSAAPPVAATVPLSATAGPPTRARPTAVYEQLAAQLLAASASDRPPVTELVMLTLHVLLLDAGLVADATSGRALPFRLPEGAAAPGGMYSLCYRHPGQATDAPGAVQVKAVQLGGSLIVHALLTSTKQPLQVTIELGGRCEAAAATTGSDFGPLLHLLGAQLVQPLLVHIRTHLLNPDSTTPALQLSDLCSEVKLAILSHLGARDLCRAAAVCRSFASLSVDDSLWRPLLLERFPRHTAPTAPAAASSAAPSAADGRMCRAMYRAALHQERAEEAGRRQRENDREAARRRFYAEEREAALRFMGPFGAPIGDEGLGPFGGGTRGIPAIGGDYDRRPFPGLPGPGGFPRPVAPPFGGGAPPRYMPAPGMPGGVVPMPDGAVPPGARYDPISPLMDDVDAGAGMFGGGGIGPFPGRGRGGRGGGGFGRGGRGSWDPDSPPDYPGPL